MIHHTVYCPYRSFMKLKNLRPSFSSNESSSPNSLNFDNFLNLESWNSILFEVVKCPFPILLPWVWFCQKGSLLEHNSWRIWSRRNKRGQRGLGKRRRCIIIKRSNIPRVHWRHLARRRRVIHRLVLIWIVGRPWIISLRRDRRPLTRLRVYRR